MVIRKNPAYDTITPPGQVVSDAPWPFPSSSRAYKPAHGGYPGDARNPGHVDEGKESNQEAVIIDMSEFIKEQSE